MTGPSNAARYTVRHVGAGAGCGVALVLTLLFVLAVLSVSAGLVVYTAWRHDLVDGLFALAFAVLSARAALSWCVWRESYQQPVSGYQRDREGRKPASEPPR